jgi:thiol-disulfide isomerase/thioredoxin
MLSGHRVIFLPQIHGPMRYTLLLLLLSFVVTAQQDTTLGIDFQQRPLAELLQQAGDVDKLIFVDAYTTWCGPCKMMDAKVFSDSAIGALFNERFINAKFDMEKGEGPALAQRYAVTAYPTYLFLNAAGELVHKGLGYIPKPALLELADVAISERSLGALKKRYDDGDRDIAFIRTYADILTKTFERERADAVIEEYLDGQDDWSTPENVNLLLASPGEVGDKRMLYLIEHAREIEGSGGTDGTAGVTRVIQNALVNDYHRSNGLRSLADPADLDSYYDEQAGELAEQLKQHYQLLYYERTQDMENYLPAAMAYYQQYPTNDFAILNGVAWNFYEHATEPDQLEQAVKWAERSVAINAYYPNLDTLAWLYKKTGREEEARKTARRAIQHAEADMLDYSDTEKIFE